MFRSWQIVWVVMLTLQVSTVSAQEQGVPRRTAEERAMKQTEMLVRDLSIRDSLTKDTIYRVHLRYARQRALVKTRQEAVECMNRLLVELKGILSSDEYERLQAIPRRQGARSPHAEQDSVAPAPTPTAP